MKIVKANASQIRWATHRLDLIKVADAKGIAAVSDEGKILCVAMMDTWQKGSVHLHITMDNPACFKHYKFMYEVADYIYNVAERRTAIVTINSDNIKALKFSHRLGFSEVGRVKDGAMEGVDTVILQLHRNDCVWLTKRKEAA